MIEWLNEPRVMGILNVTPDSFHSASRVLSIDLALIRAEEMIQQGVDVIDVGGQSTRPGAIKVSEEEELARVVPVIEALRSSFPNLKISIDTFYGSVAESSVKLGVNLINDVSNGSIDSSIQLFAAESKTPYVLMHSRGDASTMTKLTTYTNVVDEVYDFFTVESDRLLNMGIQELILDLGFGFAKTAEQNFQLLNQLEKFNALGFPQLAGLSRKKMIQSTLNVDAHAALNGTTVLNTIALMKGAKLLRVHDVQEAKEAVTLIRQLSLSSK